MKVYKSIVVDMETLEIIKHNSYEYHGPVDLCCGDGGGDGGDDSFSPAPGMTDAPIGEFGSGSSAGGGWGPSAGVGYEGSAPASDDAGVKKTTYSDKVKGALSKGAMLAIELAIAAMGPVTAAAQGLSVMVTGKGIVSNIAEVYAEYRADNPKASSEEAMDYALSEVEGGDEITDEGRKALSNSVNEVIGKDADQIVNTLESTDIGNAGNEFVLSNEETSLLDAIEQNQIDVFTKTINERVNDIASTKLADLADRGVLQGDIGATALSKIYESSADAILQGTTEIQTERMRNELSLMQTKFGTQAQKDLLMTELEWRSKESSKNRAAAWDISQNQRDASDDANKWGLFGNVGAGLIQSTNNDDFDWGKLF